MLLPWQQGLPQSTSQGALIIAIVKPAVALIKALLSQLIMARGKEVGILKLSWPRKNLQFGCENRYFQSIEKYELRKKGL